MALLTGIEIPTLVLAGRHSTVLGPEHGRAAVAKLPHGELIIARFANDGD